jgi:hypothetical protein
MEAELPNTLGDLIRAAGQSIITAPADQLGTVLAAQLQQIITPPYRVETCAIVDSEGRRTAPFEALICNGGAPIGDAGDQTAVPTESVAVAFDVTHTLDLNGLAAAYARIAAAKAMKKIFPVPGNQTIEPTLGVIFAVDSAVPLQELAEELERLNAATPSNQWADVVIIATKGQIAYSVQWVGSSKLDGLMLPPSPGASAGTIYAFYAVMLTSATGAESFNLTMHAVIGQLVRWSSGYAIPGSDTIMEGVPRQGIIWTGYQYDLSGQLRPVPPEHRQGRSLPPKSVSLYPRGSKERLAAMSFLKWQDGGVVLLRGKLPLEGMLVFLGGIIDAEAFRKIGKVTRDDLQISSVLPITERQYLMMLGNIQQRGGLDVRPDERKFVIQKFADEGSSLPFMARVFYAPLKLTESLGPERAAFEKAHHTLMTTLMEIRDTAKDVAKTWKDYARRVDDGSIIERQGADIHVAENVDRQLGRQVNEFLTSATRSFKERMQRVARSLNVEIGFLYQKEATFERCVVDLERTDPALAAYIREARRWGDTLVTTRNNVDHGDWKLQSAVVGEADGKVRVSEPAIDGVPVTRWVAEMTDRVVCFVEDVLAHCIQKRMPLGITLAEIPLAQRLTEMPVRFKPTVIGGGLPTWEIRYHASRLEET